jgi:hypothetical protein
MGSESVAGTDLSAFDDLQPFEVAVLYPGLTLLEKLVLIHALAQRLPAGGSIDRRSGRAPDELRS